MDSLDQYSDVDPTSMTSNVSTVSGIENFPFEVLPCEANDDTATAKTRSGGGDVIEEALRSSGWQWGDVWDNHDPQHLQPDDDNADVGVFPVTTEEIPETAQAPSPATGDDVVKHVYYSVPEGFSLPWNANFGGNGMPQQPQQESEGCVQHQLPEGFFNRRLWRRFPLNLTHKHQVCNRTPIFHPGGLSN